MCAINVCDASFLIAASLCKQPQLCCAQTCFLCRRSCEASLQPDQPSTAKLLISEWQVGSGECKNCEKQSATHLKALLYQIHLPTSPCMSTPAGFSYTPKPSSLPFLICSTEISLDWLQTPGEWTDVQFQLLIHMQLCDSWCLIFCFSHWLWSQSETWGCSCEYIWPRHLLSINRLLFTFHFSPPSPPCWFF